MNKTKKYNICIAGLGTVGSNVVNSLNQNHQLITNKTNIDFNILGISAKNKSKKRIFNINKYKWYDNLLDLVDIPHCDIIIELVGDEKGSSFELVKKALTNKIHVITANKGSIIKIW